MKKFRLLIVLQTLACVFAMPFLSTSRGESAAAEKLAGQWSNRDPDARGITRVEVHLSGGRISIHMWGRCHPKECDWGETVAKLESGDGEVLTAEWNQGFCTRSQKIKLLADGSLEVRTHTRYTDKSGRGESDRTEVFSKGWSRDWSDPPK